MSTEQRAEVEAALAESPGLRQHLEQLKTVLYEVDQLELQQPSDRLRSGFEAHLAKAIADQSAEEKVGGNDSKIISLTRRNRMWLQLAAASVILLLGVMIGLNISKGSEIEALREQVAMLVDAESVSQRIKGVNVSYNMPKADDKIIAVLINTMNTDESSNVRLSAIEALSRWTNENSVREALIDALRTQKDPATQITLINILVDIKEKRALPNMENLINDTDTPEYVKGETQVGIFKLKSI
ncbi:MAG: HEAT repeat domain-containing protein [Bacteroidota bacterium]